MADLKVRKYEFGALEDEGRPTKRLQVTSTHWQDVVMPNSQMVDGIGPVVDSASSSAEPQGSRFDFNPMAQISIPLTPPRTPPQQTAFSLPHIIEFEEGLARLQTERSREQSKAQQCAPPLDPYQGPKEPPPPPTPANTGAYYVPFTGESLGDGRAIGTPSLPLPKVQSRTVTSDPKLGEMFAEAAQAAGRQFYPPPPQDEAIKAIARSCGNPVGETPSRELQNNWPPYSRVVTGGRHVPFTFIEGSPPRDPGEASNFSRPQNKPVWWRIFRPPEPQLTTTKTVPDVEILQPGAVHCERPKAVLGHSIKQSQCTEHINCSPSNSEMVSGFKPVNQAFSTSSFSPAVAAQHIKPTGSRFITFAELVLSKKHPAQSSLNPTQGSNEGAAMAGASVYGITKPPNPFSSPPHRVWLHQNQLPNYHHHSINTAMAGLASSAQQFGGRQVVEDSSSSVNADKRKGRLIEVPPQVLGGHRASLLDTSFEESIRRSAKTAMELINIHGAH
jgi:hypothetical protein